VTVSPSLAVDCRCVRGGGHSRPHAAKAAQDVQEDQTEAQRTQEAVGLSAEHPSHCSHHHGSGVCGGGDHMVAAVGLYMYVKAFLDFPIIQFKYFLECSADFIDNLLIIVFRLCSHDFK